ncbi:MAG TPA: hypothetical protein VF263_06235 [Longimicrobiaceae bacterium]
MRPNRSRAFRAPLGTALALVLAVLPARSQDAVQGISRDGQRVEVQVTRHPGDATTVCLESGPGVRGRKRLVVTHGTRSAKLTTSDGDRGPHCTFFQAEGESFRVRLEYVHLAVLTTVLGERAFGRAAFAGRTLTFRWVAE